MMISIIRKIIIITIFKLQNYNNINNYYININNENNTYYKNKGYIGSLCVMMVNEYVSEEEKGLAGTFTGFFLNFGLVIGATIGLYIHDVLF